MSSLMNATISVRRCFYDFDAEKCYLLRAVSDVQNLELSGSGIQELFEIELPRCPTFFNLTTLFLGYFCMICHSNEVGDILKHTPNLKKLTLCGNMYDKHECHWEADQESNSINRALFQCKNPDEIEVELKCINCGTKQLVNTLVKSLAELKTTRLILSFHCNWTTWSTIRPLSNQPTPPPPPPLSITESLLFCLDMVQEKHVLTLFSGNKFIVWSK